MAIDPTNYLSDQARCRRAQAEKVAAMQRRVTEALMSGISEHSMADILATARGASGEDA